MSLTDAAAASSPLAKPLMTETTLVSSQAQLHKDFNLDTCTSQSLASALIAARGETEAIQILQGASKLVGGANDSRMVSPDEKRGTSSIHSEGASNGNERLLGDALLSEPIETSFLSPRMGKFSLQLHENGLQATKTNDPTVKITLLKGGTASETTDGISHVLLFPKPEDCKAIVYNRKLDSESKPKKVGGSMVVLRLESPLQIPKQKSPTQQLCFVLPADKKLGQPTAPNTIGGKTSSSDPTEAWGNLLHTALGGRLAQVLRSNDKGFKSYQPPNTSTTTAGMPFVSCYLGVNDGVLYPLEDGLLFYKPPRFLPRSSLHSIACGRGGGGGGDSSRYVDMVLQCSNSNDTIGDEEKQLETVEFTNIQREENSVLNSYIHDVLIPAMTRDAGKRDKHADGDKDDDSDEVLVEAIAEEDTDDDDDGATDGVDSVEGEDDDDSDSGDEYFEESDAESRDDDGDDSSDDEVLYGEDDEGIAVVRDEFAQELVSEKRKKNQEESVTESEGEDSSTVGQRISKRLRRTGS